MEPKINFVRKDDVDYGRAINVSALLRLVTAKNAGPYTYTGTGTYIVGNGSQVSIIDPGPALDEHIDALMQAIENQTLSHIFVTHTHKDHSPAARILARKTKAVIYGFGPHGGGQAKHLQGEDVEEGADHDFVPDVAVKDGDQFVLAGCKITAIHTPGHTSNHVCYYLNEEKTLFSGDHIMGWATSVISPPDGNMAAYLASLKKLKSLELNTIRPTHGPAINNPSEFIQAIIDHRHAREDQIYTLIGDGIDTIDKMVSLMYQHVPKTLFPAAARSVYAHILHLMEQNKITTKGIATLASRYRLI